MGKYSLYFSASQAFADFPLLFLGTCDLFVLKGRIDVQSSRVIY